ncbi:MAG TPA: four helix bundle protein [Pyrinomonadaceae bacterium]|nr:four helix bundle protein [Pyrinomonadaceae bacterium]
MQDFRKLKVWQRAHQLTLLVYKLTQDFPRDELFGLRNSIRKTCIDIPAYTADGAGRATDPEFSRSINSAVGFSSRLECYVLLAFDVNLISETGRDKVAAEILEIKKMLNGFNRGLRE